MAGPSRFASLSADEINKLVDETDSANTIRTTKTAVNLFREYLTAKNLSADFESFPQEELDEKLASFYFEMRNRKGEMYKKSTLISYRHGLQRHLEKHRGDVIDITNANVLRKSAQAFKSMTKEMKRQGLAAVDHHPPISDGDLVTLYEYLLRDNLEDSQLLQYKVFVDLMLYFGRRGRENLSSLKRDDFAVQRDDKGMLYVYKTKDELTKNHQSDSIKSSDGRMYEVKESLKCPVRSFVKYLRRLNPKCSKLFQKARSQAKDGIFFDNVPLGHNRIGAFMSEISRAANLSKIYTNHSCRATTVHVLDSAQIPSRHIMSVTGHKAETSLKTYSGVTDDNTRRLMSETISKKCDTGTRSVLVQKNTNQVVKQVQNINGSPIVQLTNSQTETLFQDIFNDLNYHISDDDDDLFQCIQPFDLPVVSSSTTTSQAPVPSGHITQASRPMPTFQNCSNFTVNFVFPK